MKIKVFLTGLIIMLIVLAFPVMADEKISVYVNDEKVNFDVEPQIVNGRTLVPMRVIFEKLGAEVSWVSDSQMIVGQRYDDTIIMQINDKSLIANNRISMMDAPPVIIDSRTFVPVRAIAESFNADVEWNENERTVKIYDENSIANDNKIKLGKELINDTSWTQGGWEGNFHTGFEHIVGQTEPLVFTMPEKTENNLYLVEFDVINCSKAGSPNASNAFSVTIGNSDPFITYNGGGPKHYSFGIRSKENGDLKFILTEPANPFKTGGSFDGTIKNVSVKRIKGTISPIIEILDSYGNISLELRASDSSNGNIYIGKNVGKYCVGGEMNVGIGNNSFANNTTGYWNTAIGADTLRDNTVGSRNVAIGRLALSQNISGDRNYAIGTLALTRNTSGRFNIAIGADALWVNTTGQRNIAIGSASQSGVENSNDNISIGQGSMSDKKSGDSNIAIGSYAMSGAGVGNDNIAIGQLAQYKGGGTSYNISIGRTAGNNMTAVTKEDGTKDGATSNVSVGVGSLTNTTIGKYNTTLGHYSGYSNITGNNNTYIGMFSGKDNVGSGNTFVGSESGQNIKSGSGNIMIGRNTAAPTSGSSNQLNIGNIIYGDLKKGLVGISTNNDGQYKAKLDIGAGNTQYPPVAISSGELTTVPIDGAIEYDGRHLYITINGIRERVVLESEVEQLIKEILDEYLNK